MTSKQLIQNSLRKAENKGKIIVSHICDRSIVYVRKGVFLDEFIQELHNTKQKEGERKEMKKLISFNVILFMILSLATTNVFADDSTTFTKEGLTYSVTDATNQTVSVTNSDTTKTEYIIPETVEDNGVTYTVTSIGQGALRDNPNLTKVDIPASVTSIGVGAFSNCSALVSIDIPDSVISIGRDAFNECFLLASVKLPKGLTKLEMNTFYGCYKLKSITIPNSVQEIHSNAFLNCTSMRTLNIPWNVRITAGSIISYSGIHTIALPNTIERLGSDNTDGSNQKNAFNHADNLKNVIAITSKPNDSVSSVIEDAVNTANLQNITYYRGVTSLTVNGNSIDAAQGSEITDINSYFDVTSEVYEGTAGGTITTTVSVPSQYLNPTYAIEGNSDNGTYMDGTTLHIGSNEDASFTLKATLNGQTVSKVVNVKQAIITSMEVNKAPSKVSYTEGESFDPTGLELKINYDNGTTTLVGYDDSTKNDFSFTVDNPLKETTTAVEITYSGHTVSLPIAVTKPVVIPTITSIEVNKAPSKVSYTEGESFDPTGLEVKAIYSDKTNKTIVYNDNTKKDFSFTIGDPLTVGDKEVKVTYSGHIVSLPITVTKPVVNPTITKIEIHKAPVKVAYVKGETFEPAGLEVTVYYSDNSKKTVAYDDSTKNDFTFMVKNPLTISDTKVVITYGGQRTEQKITVQRKPILISPEYNQIVGLKNQYTRGEQVTVSVYGAGMDRSSPVKGDTRYQPISWKIKDDQKFSDENYQISLDTSAMAAGKYMLSVTYQKEEFDGSKWGALGTVIQSGAFDITEQTKIDPVKKPEVEKTESGKEKTEAKTPETGDHTSVQSLFLLAVISGGFVLMGMKKRMNKNQ